MSHERDIQMNAYHDQVRSNLAALARRATDLSQYSDVATPSDIKALSDIVYTLGYLVAVREGTRYAL